MIGVYGTLSPDGGGVCTLGLRKRSGSIVRYSTLSPDGVMCVTELNPDLNSSTHQVCNSDIHGVMCVTELNPDPELHLPGVQFRHPKMLTPWASME
ncbi:hypothetical protein AMTR_s00045p00039850 [Amborella trichopoda]|uniref:Uncharacterized protein n=1 Tax=Amborella trichopoda TaxID=13333 RepID=W1P1Z8_AMBTC|nr:hypothetical protein AMTR_s00045p00039850 [Amborella trichopoda]